ncbi:MAG: hypothetical protein MK107_11740 [Oceanicola sp.]|nr:hypothetical protein [Oceanicola sp.]
MFEFSLGKKQKNLESSVNKIVQKEFLWSAVNFKKCIVLDTQHIISTRLLLPEISLAQAPPLKSVLAHVPKIKANDFLDVLHTLLMEHGKPKCVSSDKGPELVFTRLQDELGCAGVQLMQVFPGSHCK